MISKRRPARITMICEQITERMAPSENRQNWIMNPKLGDPKLRTPLQVTWATNVPRAWKRPQEGCLHRLWTKGGHLCDRGHLLYL